MVIDLGRIESLRGVRDDGDALVVGAMTTYQTLLDDPSVREHLLLLVKATETIADPQIRHRGTVGGALAHADPAGDLGATALALDASFVITGTAGSRTVPAGDFFSGLFETAIGDDELLTEIRFPKHTGWGAHYEKFVRVSHQWSIVAVAATLQAEGGTIQRGADRADEHGRPAAAGDIGGAGAGRSAGHRGRRTDGGRLRRRRHGAAERPERRRRLPAQHRARSSPAARCSRRRKRDRVDLTHSFTVPVDRATAWAAFQDIESVAECFPGAAVTSVEGDTFQGTCKVKLGPIALQYAGSGAFVERDAANFRMLLEAKGRDKRGNGTAGADVTDGLPEEGPSRPGSRWTTDLHITGKPAQFGRGVMQEVSDKLLGQFVTCLEARVGPPPAPAAEAAAVETAEATEATEAAAAAGSWAPEAAAAADVQPAAAPRTATPPARPPAPSGGQGALDLGSTVLPVLARTYWKPAAGVLLVLLLIRWWRRR